MTQALTAEADQLMSKTVEKMRNDLAAIRTGRAHASLLDTIRVESYGTLMPIAQMATVGVSDARTLEVRPWDISVVGDIERAILKSDLGLTPRSDGKVIRLSIPSLNEERRKELSKVVHKIAEDFRVSIRNERRQVLEKVKQAEKEKRITEDDRKKAETAIQKITEAHVVRIDELVKQKEKEIMEV